MSHFRCAFVSGAAGLCVFLNSLHGELIFDDVHAVERNQDVLGGNALSQLFVNDFWGEPMASNHSHKSYRPITVLTFRGNHNVHGLDPMGYHMVNVVLHALVSAVAMPFYVRILHGDQSVAETASLLFALHPVHCEAVASVVGRAELLGACCFPAPSMQSSSEWCSEHQMFVSGRASFCTHTHVTHLYARLPVRRRSFRDAVCPCFAALGRRRSVMFRDY